jgi:hypothetical protein
MNDLSQCGRAAFVVTIGGPNGLRMEGRSVAVSPPEGTLGYLYRQQGDAITKYCPGVFRDGRWLSITGEELKQEPSHWLALK